MPMNQSRYVDIEQVGQTDFVPPAEGPEHGYWGFVPDRTPNTEYTVAGVVGGTANVADTPPAEPETRQRANTEPLKGSKR